MLICHLKGQVQVVDVISLQTTEHSLPPSLSLSLSPSPSPPLSLSLPLPPSLSLSLSLSLSGIQLIVIERHATVQWKNGGMGTDLFEAVVVYQLRTVAVDECTERQTILETEGRGGGEREEEMERK